MNGTWLAGTTCEKQTKITTSTIVSLMATMRLLKFALMIHADDQHEGDQRDERNGGKIEIGAGRDEMLEPFHLEGRAREGGRDRHVHLLGHEVAEIARPADRHRRSGGEIFQHQVPADDPGEEPAHRRVGVGVGAAGDWDHRGVFGVAQAGEEAAKARDREGDHHARTGIACGRMAGQHEDTRADDGADAERDQMDRAQGRA